MKVRKSTKKIIVHCSATPEGRDVKTAEIRRWHMQGNGWEDIGYHYVVELDGKVVQGRREYLVGAHCSGHNSDSVGVCYVGGLAADGKTPKDTRTPQQKAALRRLIRTLKTRYKGAIVYGHRDFAPKSCPSFDARAEYESL